MVGAATLRAVKALVERKRCPAAIGGGWQDLLVQGERSVDALARASGLTFANASQAQLRRAGLVTSRRDGKRVITHCRITGVGRNCARCALWPGAIWPAVASLVRQYYTDKGSLASTETSYRSSGGRWVGAGPRRAAAMEYAAGHLPGASGIPLDPNWPSGGELRPASTSSPAAEDLTACML